MSPSATDASPIMRDQALINACSSGQLANLKSLLTQPDKAPVDSLPPLQYLIEIAIRHRHMPTLEYLFTRVPTTSASKPFPDPPAYTMGLPSDWQTEPYLSIVAAVETNEPSVFQVLLDHGVTVDARLERAITPLAVAVAMELEPMTTFLLSKGANPNRHYSFDKDTLLGRAAGARSLGIMEALLAHGARVEGSHALRQAATQGRIENARRLLEAGADINEVFTKTEYGPSREARWGSALHFALKGRQVAFVRFLIENGADVEARDEDGMTATEIARKEGLSDAVRRPGT
ncbi:hypothetical protein MMC11_005486 [Xylographa trunciseda]|nr:hypothetical protein [Xylographa trunciseda]